MQKLRVILVEQGVTDADALSQACEISQRLRLSDDLQSAIVQQQPDMVILDVRTPGASYLHELHRIQSAQPIPIVIFSQDDAQQTIELAVQSGVSAYIVDSIQCPRLLPILQTAMARFQRFSHIQQELDKTRAQLEDRKIIEQAKGILMQQRKLSEADAYQLLRKSAMDKNKTLSEIAHSILDAASLLI